VRCKRACLSREHLLDFLLAAIVFGFLLPRRCDVCHNHFDSADAALNSAHAPVD